jgi:UDP-N-acetylmuramyl pentapeptide synthase
MKLTIKKISAKKLANVCKKVGIVDKEAINELDADVRNNNFKKFTLGVLNELCERVDALEEKVAKLTDEQDAMKAYLFKKAFIEILEDIKNQTADSNEDKEDNEELSLEKFLKTLIDCTNNEEEEDDDEDDED